MDAVKERIMELMGPQFRVRDRDEQQATVFKVLQSEGLMTYLILSLTLAIACFTILGAITISLVEKDGICSRFGRSECRVLPSEGCSFGGACRSL